MYNFESMLQVSFDDVCHMDSVITRVAMSELEPEKFAISKPHIKQTKKLLKEALAAERREDDTVEDAGTVLCVYTEISSTVGTITRGIHYKDPTIAQFSNSIWIHKLKCSTISE